MKLYNFEMPKTHSSNLIQNLSEYRHRQTTEAERIKNSTTRSQKKASKKEVNFTNLLF